jgi:hypothetical protein
MYDYVHPFRFGLLFTELLCIDAHTSLSQERGSYGLSSDPHFAMLSLSIWHVVSLHFLMRPCATMPHKNLTLLTSQLTKTLLYFRLLTHM